MRTNVKSILPKMCRQPTPILGLRALILFDHSKSRHCLHITDLPQLLTKHGFEANSARQLPFFRSDAYIDEEFPELEENYSFLAIYLGYLDVKQATKGSQFRFNDSSADCTMICRLCQ